MNEVLKGDSQEPDKVLDTRRQITAEYTAGLLTEKEAIEQMEQLLEENPTVNAAYERNLREQSGWQE